MEIFYMYDHLENNFLYEPFLFTNTIKLIDQNLLSENKTNLIIKTYNIKEKKNI